MTDGKDTAAKTKPLISKENAQNRPETIQRGQVLGVSAFREQIGNSAAKRRCPLCPVCRNTSRENGRSFLMSVAGRNTTSFVQSYGINLICIEEGIDSSQTSGKLLISVLSAVAEIERENIIEQTMNGRREKARQGGWNGGFAPYGYYLKDNQLLIEETEAEAIRIVYYWCSST